MFANRVLAYFHADSSSVRFWVRVKGLPVGASVPSHLLRHFYHASQPGDDVMALYRAHAEELAEAVKRRVAGGSIEPVMLRERDLEAPA